MKVLLYGERPTKEHIPMQGMELSLFALESSCKTGLDICQGVSTLEAWACKKEMELVVKAHRYC